MTYPLLRKGAKGADVRTLQKLLIQLGYDLKLDGDFGKITVDAVSQFQYDSKPIYGWPTQLACDGVVGEETWKALWAAHPEPADNKIRVTDADFAAAAKALGVSVRDIKTVNLVESPKGSFLPDGRPPILFERHWMRRRLESMGINSKPYQLSDPDIVNIKSGGYLGGAAEYTKLERAKKINITAALESASWGAYQLMGFHWKTCGYSSVQTFVEAMGRSEAAQLDALVRFIKSDKKLQAAMQTRDWDTFAKIYNGPGNVPVYGAKLRAAYAKLA